MTSALPIPSNDERRNHERRILRVQAELILTGRPPMAVRTMDISEVPCQSACAH